MAREFKEICNDNISAIYDDNGNKVAECYHEDVVAALLKHLGVKLEYVERLDVEDFPDHVRDIQEAKAQEDVCFF